MTNIIYLLIGIYLFVCVRAACDQILQVGNDIADAVSSAGANTVICLEAGNYDEVDLYEIQRTSYVTIQSKTGVSAIMYPQVGHSAFIKFYSLTIDGALQNSCSQNIQWLNNNVTDAITLTNDGCDESLETLFDGNVFAHIEVGTYEGRLSLIYGSGITVTNNQFGPAGASDGVFMGGDVSDVVIGPGNTFTGILEELCGTVHCDAIQGYGAGTGITIQGNLFTNGDTFIMMPDGSQGVLVRNNVFNGTITDYPDKIQFGFAESPIFIHNTVVNIRASFDSKDGDDASSNALVRDNIFIMGSSIKTAGGNGCSNCTFNSNQFDSASDASGTNVLNSAPVFVGGALPSSFSGFTLTTSSPGHAAASDGTDMGANTSNTSVVPPTSPPSQTTTSAASTSSAASSTHKSVTSTSSSSLTSRSATSSTAASATSSSVSTSRSATTSSPTVAPTSPPSVTSSSSPTTDSTTSDPDIASSGGRLLAASFLVLVATCLLL